MSIEINTSLVEQLVSTQFPQWAHLAVRPVEFDGWDNRTFRLGADMSVRLPSAQGYAGQVEKEHHWLPRLAPHLPLPIPIPLALGVPAAGYPWHWSVYRWLEGDIATVADIAVRRDFAVRLAEFLVALQQIDPTGGPPPGAHNFYRGGSLVVYDTETRDAIFALRREIDASAASGVWEAGLRARWQAKPVWVHGDVAAGNLLVQGGRLSAVIDFGCCAIGDPASDLVIAWTLFEGESREAFYAALPLDAGTWARGRGWALWKALITLREHIGADAMKAAEARRVLDEVLTDHRRRITPAGR